MFTRLIALALASLLSGCDYVVNTTNDNKNDNTNNNILTPSPSVPVPGSGTGGGTTNGRVPDPVPGQILPIPSYTQSVINQVNVANPTLIATSSCPTAAVNGWRYLEAVILALQVYDTRWGYSCGATCATIFPDLVAYHATAGPDITGAVGVRTVDILTGQCAAAPTSTYVEMPYNPAGKWSVDHNGL